MATLNLAAWAAPVSTLGPGLRAAVWVQGCCFDCPGCIAPEWRFRRGGAEKETGALAREILAIDERASALEGMTFSGGEPMLQAAALLALWRQIRDARPDWTLVLYTGYTMNRINRSGTEAQRDLCGDADVLIDGVYDGDLNDGHGLRGSTNQRIHTRSAAYHDREEWFRRGQRRVELRFRGDDLLVVGVPPLGLGEALDRALAG